MLINVAGRNHKRPTFFDPRQTEEAIPPRHEDHVIPKILPLDFGFLEDDNVRLQRIEHSLVSFSNGSRQKSNLPRMSVSPSMAHRKMGFYLSAWPEDVQTRTYRIPFTADTLDRLLNPENILTIPRRDAKPHSEWQADSPCLSNANCMQSRRCLLMGHVICDITGLLT